MSKNHKVISNLTKSTDQHKFNENRNWNKFENSEKNDDKLYFEYARLPRLVTGLFEDE
ncbi:MAG: hypothetical protein ACM31M_04160 [Nitrososphaerota archaeon]